MIYQILLCLHPHIYKSIKTTPDLHWSKMRHLACYNQYDIVPHRTNSSFALFHYITTHTKNPLNCKSSYTISDHCTVCWQQFLLTCSDFSSGITMSFMIQLHQNQNTNLSPFLIEDHASTDRRVIMGYITLTLHLLKYCPQNGHFSNIRQSPACVRLLN